MSDYGYERASLVLPQREVAGVRAIIIKQMNKTHEQARDAATAFWATYDRRSTASYEAQLDAWLRREFRSAWGRAGTAGTLNTEQQECLRELLLSAAGRPHRLTVAEVDSVFPRANSRTTRFRLGPESVIVLKGRDLSWACADNNHGIERLHEQPAMVALMSGLERIAWTRGTGGRALCVDEGSRDSAQYDGGDASYVRQQWGPRGRLFVSAA